MGQRESASTKVIRLRREATALLIEQEKLDALGTVLRGRLKYALLSGRNTDGISRRLDAAYARAVEANRRFVELREHLAAAEQAAALAWEFGLEPRPVREAEQTILESQAVFALVQKLENLR